MIITLSQSLNNSHLTDLPGRGRHARLAAHSSMLPGRRLSQAHKGAEPSTDIKSAISHIDRHGQELGAKLSEDTNNDKSGRSSAIHRPKSQPV